MRENVIEFFNNDKVATVTLSQGRYITKVKKLAEKYPNECKIVAENNDGSIVAKIPTSAIKINVVKRNMTEEQRQANTERLKEWRLKSGNN